MSWGSGTGVIATGQDDTIERLWSGSWVHRTVTTYSYLVRALSSANAIGYTPTAAHSGALQNIRRQRVDESNQWQVVWDEVVLDPSDGTYTAGYNP